MTSPSPTPREERFKQLCAEINELISRYPDMPPGRPQAICQSEIDKRYLEIDQMNAEQYAEDVASARSAPRNLTSTHRQAAGAAVLLADLGLIFHAYTLVVIGGALFLFSTGIMSRISGPVPEPPDPVRERFHWRP